MRKTIYEMNYDRLNKILEGKLDEFVAHGEYKKLKAPGFMDLSIDNLGGGRLALAHNYIINGDVVPDPDMEIMVNVKAKTVEALTYQGIEGYRQVYWEEHGKTYVNIKLKEELNKFLGLWLRNIAQQGHKEIKE